MKLKVKEGMRMLIIMMKKKIKLKNLRKILLKEIINEKIKKQLQKIQIQIKLIKKEKLWKKKQIKHQKR